MVVPGFCDSHTHPVSSGVEMGQLSMGEAADRPAIESMISAYAASHPELEWVVGGGWNTTAWPGDPTRQQLDALIPDRPAVFTTSDAHTAWVNSKALAAAGIDATTPDPPGGRIEHSADGSPSGLLREDAIELLSDHLPPVTREAYKQGALVGLRMAARYGITTVQEADATPEILQAYADLESEGRLTARVMASLHTEASLGPAQVEALQAQRAGWVSPLRHARGAKIFVDGVMESRTAALLEPYTGYPQDRGLLSWPETTLRQTVLALDAAGFQIHAHTIGDRAVRVMLDDLEAARASNGRRDARHHLAHLQLVDPADIPRFAQLGVVANIQPLWAYRDAFIRDLTEPVLGPRRSAAMYPFASLFRSGAVLVAGSDWSVSSMNPLQGMEVALTRSDPDQGGPSWIPEQRLDLPTILAAYTINGAYLSFSERQTGSLEKGKQADLVVLERNLFDIPAEQIGEVRVLWTLLAGRPVYADPAFAPLGSFQPRDPLEPRDPLGQPSLRSCARGLLEEGFQAGENLLAGG
jgi:predicted amidohydrolase YtcJ